MMLAALLSRLPAVLWRLLAGGVVVTALVLWLCNAAWHRGAAHEAAAWTARVAAAEADRRNAERRLQTAVDTAATARAGRDAAYAAARAATAEKVTSYVATPAAAVPCPDGVGVRLGTAAIAAANAALAAR